MASVPMNHGFGDATEELMHHDRLVVLRDRIKGLLDHMATKWVHGKVQCVATDGCGDLDDLLRSSMLKAPLDQKVAKAIDHERVRLRYNCLDNVVFLLGGAHLELLLEKDGGLLVIVADNLVDNVFPVASHIAIEQTTIVEWLCGGEIGLTFRDGSLLETSLLVAFIPRTRGYSRLISTGQQWR